MQRAKLFPAIFLAGLACGGATVPTIETAHFAPALNVDLHASIKTAHGVYYRDLAPGTGAPVQAGQDFAVLYTGWLIDGTQFDSNASTGAKQFDFVLGAQPLQVIQGFDEGVVGMNIGGTRQLIIPSALGYGPYEQQTLSGVTIPANSILVFKVQLTVPVIETALFGAAVTVDLPSSIRMSSGEYYRDFTVGTGPVVAAGQTLSTHYTGRFANGLIFQTNLNGAAFSFVLGAKQVIQGWDDGVVGMRVGGTRQLVIPSSLAYGPQGQGAIPGNAILVFTVTVDSAQ